MHNEVHQAKSGLVAAMTVFLFADTVIIAARVYVRAFMIRAFGWDDATLCLSYVRASFRLAHSWTRTMSTETNAFAKMGYIIACIMGFVSMYFGYAYDGPPKDWPNFDEGKAQKVSKDLHGCSRQSKR